MSSAIRVLVVDDSEDDALLMTDALRESGCEATYARVDTRDEMKNALLKQTWDIIIADYTMPHFSGPDALKVLQESGLDIPLILVSGTTEEHTGVDMMRAGAQDFIIKHNLCRLAPAVTREIGEAESRKRRKKAEDAARTAAENYKTMFEYSPVAIVTYNRDAVISQVNPAFEELYGFTAEEVIGKHKWETFMLPENAEAARELASRIFNGEIVRNAEYQHMCKDGTAIYVIANITPVCDEEGAVIMALAMITDITEHRLVEAHKRDFYRRTILAATNDKLLICEKEDIFDTAGNMLGFWPLASKEQLAEMRDDISQIALGEGMNKNRVPELLGCIVEAAGNALKHAKAGEASLYRTDDSLFFIVSDSGPGIGALALPDVALIRGYSTAGTLGMGYKIMIEYADRVYLATGPDGTTVATMMSLRPELPDKDAFLRNLTSRLWGETPEAE